MLEDLARLVGTRTLLAEAGGTALGKAMPPSAKPGKRRPCPRAVSMPRANSKCTSDCGGAVPADRAELLAKAGGIDSLEVARLQRELTEMTSRCERQAVEITQLRRRLRDNEDRPPVPPPPSERRCVDGETQTDEAPQAPPSPPPGADHELQQGLEAQRRQLDALQQEAGEKGRELGRAKASQRLLQVELNEQRMIADQYREQVSVLEEQLRQAMSQRREQVCLEMSRRPASASSRGPAPCERALFGGGSSRPASARAPPKAWTGAGAAAASTRSRPASAHAGSHGGGTGQSLAGVISSESEGDEEQSSVEDDPLAGGSERDGQAEDDAGGGQDAAFRSRRERESHSLRETWTR